MFPRSTSAIRSRLLLIAVTLAAPAAGLAQDATITVTDKIIRYAADMPPLGLNSFGDVGGTPHSAGNLIFDPGFEPATMRDLYHVIDSGEDKGKRWITLDGSGTSDYLLYTTGTYSGASMRAYRFLDAAGKPLQPTITAAWADGGKLIDGKQGRSLVKLFDTTVVAAGAPNFPEGGWLAPSPDKFEDWVKLPKDKVAEYKNQWRVYYESDQPLQMDDVVMFQKTVYWPEASAFHPRVAEKGVRSTWTEVIGKVKYIPLPSDAPPEMNGGHGAMQLTPEGGVGQVWHKLFCATGRSDAKWYSSLEEGLKYRYEAWVKTTGNTGKITFGFGENMPNSLAKGYFGTKIEQTFDVTSQWQRVGFEFTAPHTPAEGNIDGAILHFEGDGPLLVDNVKLQPVYQEGDAEKPFVIDQKLFKEMMRTQPPTGHKGAQRIWAGLSDGKVEALCSWTPDNKLSPGGVGVNVSPNLDTTLPKALTIIEATGDSPETRMVPWIIMQITDTEDEYRQLIEYLAAPYDPAKDSPQTKPMAYLRTQQRGNNRPWADDFRQIIIEYGNENWHNRKNASWIGLGRYGAVHQAGPEYGMWARYMTDQMAKSPYWNGEKFKLVLGGNYSTHVDPDGTVGGYGQEATQYSGGINAYEGHATYVGPRWETGDHSETTIDDNGVQKTLLAYRGGLNKEWAKQAAANDALHAKGFHTALAAYEGGPSGFGLRAKSAEEDKAGEYYGKSSAMAAAMLDAWIDAWRLGWGYQCYFTYGQGHWWNSHTSFANGFRASPSFEVQCLINRYMANMDMVEADVKGGPMLTVARTRTAAEIKKGKPAEMSKVPAVYAHAMLDANRLSVSVVNLDLSAAHRVQIKLPIASAKAITAHGLTGGPRDTNVESSKATIDDQTLDAAALKNGTFTAELKPGTGTIFVFEK